MQLRRRPRRWFGPGAGAEPYSECLSLWMVPQMKTTKWLTAGGLMIALVAPGVVFAADAVAFNKADANGDYMISMDELTSHPELHAQFRSLDRDGNGMLDRAEFDRGLANAISTRAREAG